MGLPFTSWRYLLTLKYGNSDQVMNSSFRLKIPKLLAANFRSSSLLPIYRVSILSTFDGLTLLRLNQDFSMGCRGR